ncbi:NifB/NifX family molybdenum-iron cluster-binding protein [Sulfurovum sp.]|uniref:NifB/NifX family molybdenum-iron cluster-binding protein n=1 Tax=Sulfurovum sp. TaxID=1969726 RepID=UPI00356A9257
MTLIPVEEDKKTIAGRFRKAHSFAFLDEGQIIVQENPHKTSKSPEFFEYFKTLDIDTLYVKELGYNTFLTLLELGVEVYLIQEADTYNRIKPNNLLLLNMDNAQEHCSLGHHNKEEGK